MTTQSIAWGILLIYFLYKLRTYVLIQDVKRQRSISRKFSPFLSILMNNTSIDSTASDI